MKIGFQSLATLAVAVGGLAAEGGTWDTKAPLPIGKTPGGDGVAVLDGRLYVFTSAAQSMGPDPRPISYDPGADTWSILAADPITRSGVAAESVNGKIYVAGGWIGSDSNAPTSALRIYDPATNSWSAGASMSIARGQTASAAINGKVYVTGGRGPYFGPRYDALSIYDPLTNAWSAGAPLPIAVEAPVGVALDGRFYVLGGHLGPPSEAMVDTLQIYDPQSNIWEIGPSMPTARFALSAGVLDGKLYAVCGHDGIGLVSTLEVFDPASNMWSTESPAPAPQFVAGAGVIDSKFYLAGGAPDDITLHVYTPAINADTDGDGLLDIDEIDIYGTDPNNPDTDSDGLLDGTEVDMAQGTGCPDPLNPDSDGDTLSDGTEVALGTSPCDPDSDGDGIPDNVDPLPLDPEGTADYLEAALRTLCDFIHARPLSEFDAPNNNAARGRQNAMCNKVMAAANAVADEEFDSAIDGLSSLLGKLDDDANPPDWMYPGQARDDIRDEIEGAIAILLFM